MAVLITSAKNGAKLDLGEEKFDSFSDEGKIIAYTVNGGTSWTFLKSNETPFTDATFKTKVLAPMFTAGGELKFITDETNGDAKIYEFEAIDKRPAAPTVVVNYLAGDDGTISSEYAPKFKIMDTTADNSVLTPTNLEVCIVTGTTPAGTYLDVVAGGYELEASNKSKTEKKSYRVRVKAEVAADPKKAHVAGLDKTLDPALLGAAPKITISYSDTTELIKISALKGHTIYTGTGATSSEADGASADIGAADNTKYVISANNSSAKGLLFATLITAGSKKFSVFKNVTTTTPRTETQAENLLPRWDTFTASSLPSEINNAATQILPEGTTTWGKLPAAPAFIVRDVKFGARKAPNTTGGEQHAVSLVFDFKMSTVYNEGSKKIEWNTSGLTAQG